MHELIQVLLMDFDQFLSINGRSTFWAYYKESLGDAVLYFVLTTNQRVPREDPSSHV